MCGVIQAELLFDLSPISEVGQLPRVVPEAAELQICGERLDRRREQDWRELLLSSELVAAWSSLCFVPAGLWHSQEKAFGLTLPKPSISFSAENQINL